MIRKFSKLVVTSKICISRLEIISVLDVISYGDFLLTWVTSLGISPMALLRRIELKDGCEMFEND